MTDENQTLEIPDFTGDMIEALALPLLLHGPPSPDGTAAEWLRITGKDEMSARVMCDHVRALLYRMHEWTRDAGLITEAEMREKLAKYR